MKTKHYESIVIINAALDDGQIEETISKIEETIKLNGGEISETDKWGRKRLAYPIQKAKSAYYCIFRFTAPTDLIAKLERFYRLDENITRQLTIVLDKNALLYIEESKLKTAEESEKVTETVEEVIDIKKDLDEAKDSE
jgi:small subunit ribosomal protein S6